MSQLVDRVDIWAARTVDKPGSVAGILKGLYEAGADLDFVIARRSSSTPGTGVVFLTPIQGDREIEAASTLGFNLTNSVSSVRVEGDNVPGAAAKLSELISDADINIRGLSVAVIGSRYIGYIGFDSADDAQRAAEILQATEAIAA